MLKIENLNVLLKKDKINRKIIKEISFNLGENEILGLVGESGSGKSITSMAIMRLLDEKTFDIEGNILFEGKDLLKLKEKQMCKVRGNDISVIYQEPSMCLDPLMTIKSQIKECVSVNNRISKKETDERIINILKKVQINNVMEILKRYPHELSGGQMQRVMIAMALITDPKILIADEPTTALDVTIQKEIIYLIKDLSKEMNMSVLFITHDLGLVAEICDRVIVMYEGQIIEDSKVLDFFDNPKKEYSKRLLYSRPCYLQKETDLLD